MGLLQRLKAKFLSEVRQGRTLVSNTKKEVGNYFGVGERGLGTFGRQVGNIARSQVQREIQPRIRAVRNTVRIADTLASSAIDRTQNYRNQFKVKGYSPSDITLTGQITKLAKPMIQGTARSIASLVPAVTKKPIQVNTTARKALFGNQYQDIQKPTIEGIRNLQDLGVGEQKAKKYGPVFGVAMTALDVIPGIGGKDDLVKGLVKATTKSGVKKLLPKIADDVAETIAKTTDAKAIRNLIKPQKAVDALKNEARVGRDYVADIKKDKFTNKSSSVFKLTSEANKKSLDVNNRMLEIAKSDQKIYDANKSKTIEQLRQEIADSKKFYDSVGGSYDSTMRVKKDIINDKLSSLPPSTKGAKVETKPLVKLPKAKVESPQTVPLKTETPPIKPEMATVEQAISHPDKVAKATAVGVDPSFEKIVAKTPATVKEKVNILDYIRTPDRVMKKIGLGKETEVLRKSYDKYLDEIPKEIDKIKVWANQSTPQENQNIFRYLDGQKVSLSAKEQKIASEVQSYLKDWADKLKLPQDKRISNYITHIFEKDFIGKEFPEDIAKIIQDRVPGSVYDPFTEQRLGKLGYVEDTWRALDAYVKRATRKYNLDPVLGNISKKADALEQSQYKYVKNYLDRINMRPTEVDNLVDNFIKSTPIGYKLGQRPTTALTRTGRQMVYRGTLGLNVSSALKNLSQGANTYAKLGEKYTAKGYFDLAKNWRSDELQRVGILRDNFIQDKQIRVYKQALEKVDKGLLSLFEGAEKVNRGAAYYGAKAKALAQGKTEQEAIDFAKKIVRDTQFTFGSIDTPVAMQSDLVKLATQFQSFTVKQGEFLGEMVASKDIAGLARWLGASLLFVYGVGELFGMEPKDLIPTVRIGTPPAIQGAVQGTKYLLKSPNKYGQPTSLKDVGNAFLPFVPAGVQLKKTIEGLGAANRGYSQTSSGNVRYPVEQNITNKIRGGLFGQYNFNEAKEYFNKGRSALSEQQSEIFKLGGGAGYYGKVMGDRESSKQAEEEMKALKSNKKTTAQDLGEGVYQLSNGKFYVQSLDKSFSDVKDADIAIKGDDFIKSGKKELITDDYVFEKADTGKGYKATPRIDYEIDVRDGTYGTLATLKKNKDIEGWMKEAETLVALYDAKLQDPDITSKEKRELEGKKRSLEDSMSKYASYGGFTKGGGSSKAKKEKTYNLATVQKVNIKTTKPAYTTKIRSQRPKRVKFKSPKIKTYKLKAQKAPKLKKLRSY